MKFRTFPGSAVSVSEIGFGMWTVATGWWGEKTDEQAIAMLRRARDEYGINFFDAADSYGNGRSDDGTLGWLWSVGPDGSRNFRAYLWNGKAMERIVHDEVAAPPK